MENENNDKTPHPSKRHRHQLLGSRQNIFSPINQKPCVGEAVIYEHGVRPLQWASGLLEFLLSQTLLALLAQQSRSSTAIISSFAQLELAIRGICDDEVYPSSWPLRKTILVGISFSSQAFR